MWMLPWAYRNFWHLKLSSSDHSANISTVHFFHASHFPLWFHCNFYIEKLTPTVKNVLLICQYIYNLQKNLLELLNLKKLDRIWVLVKSWLHFLIFLGVQSSTSNWLKYVVVPFIANNKCVRPHTNYWSSMITSNMICAGFFTGETDSCQGDSG